jgi:hypothetical protein
MMAAQFLQDDEVGIVLCDADLVDEHLRPLRSRLWQRQHFRSTRRTADRLRLAQGRGWPIAYISFGNCMGFRSCLKDLALPFPSDDQFVSGQHDIFIALTAVYSGVCGVSLVKTPLLAYRQHQGQLSQQLSREHLHTAPIGRTMARIATAGKRPTDIIAPYVQRLRSPLGATLCRDRQVRQAVLAHWDFRCNLPSSHLARLSLVAKELMSGRYHRYSNGLLTAIKDLVLVS